MSLRCAIPVAFAACLLAPSAFAQDMAALMRTNSAAAEASFSLYAGYPGEPALGPPAFMHRASGLDIPAAPITHHWQDSTHVTFGVLTAGLVQNDWKIEASQFTGREPDQYRLNFDKPKFGSTAARLNRNPDANWSLQAS